MRETIEHVSPIAAAISIVVVHRMNAAFLGQRNAMEVRTIERPTNTAWIETSLFSSVRLRRWIG